MSTSGRPTWNPIKGMDLNSQGNRAHAPIKQFSSREMPAHTKLKFRQTGQNSVSEITKRDLLKELQDRENILVKRKREGSFNLNDDNDNDDDDDDDDDQEHNGRNDKNHNIKGHQQLKKNQNDDDDMDDDREEEQLKKKKIDTNDKKNGKEEKKRGKTKF